MTASGVRQSPSTPATEGPPARAGHPLLVAWLLAVVPIGVQMFRLRSLDLGGWMEGSVALGLLLLAGLQRLRWLVPVVVGVVVWTLTVWFGPESSPRWYALELMLGLGWALVCGAADLPWRRVPDAIRAAPAVVTLLAADALLVGRAGAKLPAIVAAAAWAWLGLSFLLPSVARVLGKPVASARDGLVRVGARAVAAPRRRALELWHRGEEVAADAGPWSPRRRGWWVFALAALPFVIQLHRRDAVESAADTLVVLGGAAMWAVLLDVYRPRRLRRLGRRALAPGAVATVLADLALVFGWDLLRPLGLIVVAALVTAAVAFEWPVALEWADATDRWVEPFITIGRLVRTAAARAFGPLGRALRSTGGWLAAETTEPGEARPEPSSWVARYRVPLLAWTVLVLASNWLLGVSGANCTGCGGPVAGDFTGRRTLTTGWIHWDQWDSGLYREIAQHGYAWNPGHQQGTTVGQFPVYPLLMRWLGAPLHDVLAAGVLITLASGLAISLLFWRWLTLRGLDGRARTTAFLLLLVYPYSFMIYGAIYADALSLALVLGAFVLLETDHRALAGLVGAVATASRPNALPVIVGLVAVAVERDGVVTWSHEQGLRIDRSRWRWSAGAPALSALGIVAYAVYCWHRFGDAMLFYRVQHYWGHGPFLNAQTWLKIDYLREFWANGNGHGNDVNSLVSGAIVLFAIALVPAVVRRHGLGYAVYVAGVIASTIVGAVVITPGGRHLMVAFPAFAVVGERLATRGRLRVPVLALSTVLVLGMTALFALGRYDIGW